MFHRKATTQRVLTSHYSSTVRTKTKLRSLKDCCILLFRYSMERDSVRPTTMIDLADIMRRNLGEKEQECSQSVVFGRSSYQDMSIREKKDSR